MTYVVVDASVIVDAVTGAPGYERTVATIAGFGVLHVPEHFHVDVLSAVRGLHRRGQITADDARDALDLVAVLRVLRHPVLPLARGIWSLRDSLTAHDAAYLVLARELDLPILSADRTLAAAAAAEGRAFRLDEQVNSSSRLQPRTGPRR